MALFDRCIAAPELTTLQRECYELPMVCFLIALKFSDGCPPLLEDLCRSVKGISSDPHTVQDLEHSVLVALHWKIDIVTITHLTGQAVQLLPADRRDTWRASIRQHVDVYHAQCISTDHRASTAAAAIIGAVAHAEGLDMSWLLRILGVRGAEEVSAMQRLAQELRSALSRAPTPRRGGNHP